MTTDPDHQESPPEPNHAESYDTDIRFAIPGYETLHEVAAALLTVELTTTPLPCPLHRHGHRRGDHAPGPPHPDWHITAVDPSAPMLAFAKRKVIAADLRPGNPPPRLSLRPSRTAEAADAMFAGLPQVIHFIPESRLHALLTEAGFTTIQPIFRALVIGAWLAYRGGPQ